MAVVAGRDACGFLASVLEGVECEVGESGDVVLGGVDAEDAALVAGPVTLGQRGGDCAGSFLAAYVRRFGCSSAATGATESSVLWTRVHGTLLASAV